MRRMIEFVDTGDIARYAIVVGLVAGLAGCDACPSPGGAGAPYVEAEVDEVLEDYNDSYTPPEPSCEDVTLVRSGGEPFERIEVDFEFSGDEHHGGFLMAGPFGVDVQFDDPDEQSLFLPVNYDTEEGTHYFFAPHHPAGMDGGEATLVFTDGPRTCEQTPSWTVEPIDPAPGAIHEYLDARVDLSRAVIESFGYDPDEVVHENYEDLPAPIAPLAFQVWALNHPDNPDSVDVLIDDGELPFDDVTDEDIEVVEAYIDQADLAGYARRNLEAFQEYEAQFDDDLHLMRDGSPGQFNRGVSPCELVADAVRPEIETAADLSRAMHRSHRVETLADDLAMGANVAGLVSIAPGPHRLASSIVGFLLGVGEALAQGLSKMLPRELKNPQVHDWSDFFVEDTTEPKQWSNYTVDAHSRGWDGTAELITHLRGLISNVKVLRSKRNNTSGDLVDQIEGMLDDVADDADGVIVQIADGLGDFVADALRTEATEFLYDGTGGCYIEPQVWEEIPLVPSQWREVGYYGDIEHRDAETQSEFCYGTTPPHQDLDRREYEPTAVGTGRIGVGPDRDLFPLQREIDFYDAVWEGQVETHPIDVEIMEGRAFGEPGEVIELTGEIRQAHDPDGDWEILVGGGEIYGDPSYEVDTSTGHGVHSAQLQLPEDEDEFPLLVGLDSTSSQGLRSSACDPEPRRDRVIVRNAEEGGYFQIDPTFRCMAPGTELDFQADADVPDQSDPTVRWHADGGSIDPEGTEVTFATEQEGEYTVTATVEGTDLEQRAQVRAGACECYYNVTFTGGLQASYGAFENIFAWVSDGNFFVNFGGALEIGEPEGALGADNAPFGREFVRPNDVSAIEFDGAGTGFDGVAVWPHEGGFLAIYHWSDDDYVQGMFAAPARAGLLPTDTGAEPVHLPPTFVTVRFMAPVAKDPYTPAYTDCNLGL